MHLKESNLVSKIPNIPAEGSEGGMLNTSGKMTNSDYRVWLCNVWHPGLKTTSQYLVWKQIKISVHVCKEQPENIVPKPKNGGKGRKHEYINNFKFSSFILTSLRIFEHAWLLPFMRDGTARVKGNIAAPAVSSFMELWLNVNKLLGWAGGLYSPLVLTLSLCHFCS